VGLDGRSQDAASDVHRGVGRGRARWDAGWCLARRKPRCARARGSYSLGSTNRRHMLSASRLCEVYAQVRVLVTTRARGNCIPMMPP
jgi:hypothetical protein